MVQLFTILLITMMVAIWHVLRLCLRIALPFLVYSVLGLTSSLAVGCSSGLTVRRGG